MLFLALPATGQDLAGESDAVHALGKIVVTGSYIPTVERETALPVQVITRDEIERANILTAAQLVNTISATMSFSAFNEVQAVGWSRNGGICRRSAARARLSGYAHTG